MRTLSSAEEEEEEEGPQASALAAWKEESSVLACLVESGEEAETSALLRLTAATGAAAFPKPGLEEEAREMAKAAPRSRNAPATVRASDEGEGEAEEEMSENPLPPRAALVPSHKSSSPSSGLTASGGSGELLQAAASVALA